MIPLVRKVNKSVDKMCVTLNASLALYHIVHDERYGVLMDRPVSLPALFAWYERSEAVSKESKEDGKEKSLRQSVPWLTRL